ncbi:MAG TPA: helix-turn-helix domain-containing protein [Pseudonocardiaceae bacterium]
MAGRRSYGDPCGTARALDVIGERWALLVVRELLFGPKRFTELSRGLPGMSQNVLAARLRELETDGVVRNYRLGPPASTRVYELTPRGYELEELLIALGRWGSKVPLDAIDAAAELSVDALVLALRTTFDARRAGALRARVELCLDGDRFHAEIADGEFTIGRGGVRDADAILDAGVATVRSVIFDGLPLTDAVRSRALLLTGDQRVAARFVNCFPRPQPVY